MPKRKNLPAPTDTNPWMPTMDLGLSGETVLLTGGSGGIGAEVARQFAAEGARVVVTWLRNEDAVTALRPEIGSDRFLGIHADLTREADVAAAFDQASRHFGKIGMLVCCAGVWPPDSIPLHQMSVAQWRNTVDQNLLSSFLCCRQYMQQLARDPFPDPSIVLAGSTAGVFGEAGHGDYAASKSALQGLMNSLKNEIVSVCRHGRVNLVSPGWTITPMTRSFADDGSAMRRALATIPLRKVATPADIAHAILFLSSRRVAGHITGQHLVVSGGMEGRQLFDEKELQE